MKTTTDLKRVLNTDSVSKRNGVFTARWEFFYRMGKTPNTYENEVKSLLPEAKIIKSGEVWKPFRGGTTTAQSSHFYVEFTLE